MVYGCFPCRRTSSRALVAGVALLWLFVPKAFDLLRQVKLCKRVYGPRFLLYLYIYLSTHKKFIPCVLQVRGDPRLRRSVRKSIPQGSIRLPPTLTQDLTSEQQQLVSRVQFNFYQESTVYQVYTFN